jgi:hypothetical protein
MTTTNTEIREELLREIEGLSTEKIKEILDFTYFIKAKDAIDPSQAYFWTSTWQKMEKEAEKDKNEGRTVGNGTVENLLSELKK